MSQEIYIDVNYLTESERDTVLQVLSRDEELRRQEKRRIGLVHYVLLKFLHVFSTSNCAVKFTMLLK